MPENKNDPRQRQGNQGVQGDQNKGDLNKQQQGNVEKKPPMQDDKKKGMGQGQSTKEGKNIPDESLDEDDRITQRNPVPRGNEEE